MRDSLNYDPHTHTEYSGPVGHEKKFYKTHFAAPGRHFRVTRDNGYEWVEVKPGRYVRRRKVENAKENNT